ncbi:glycosyltransferase family 41 protein [Atractiella rhizophila]|nr:glycosyltransferase family 41 protein [Atractiella rhizophila]
MRAVLETVQKEGRCTEETRDYLLSAAHVLYIRAPKDDYLLGLLHTVTDLHPTHLPSLLLLSCVYYSRGDLVGSVAQNAKILEIDPNYVEAMSNLGTTYRAMGRTAEAETWWRRAVGIRPSYFDAFDNLLGVLCNPNPQKPQEGPRYREALELCEQVERGIYVNGFDDTNVQIPLRPLVLPSFIPIDHVHRLQNLFYAKGNLQSALGNPLAAQDEYIKAVEIALSTPVRRLSEVTSRPNIKDLILGSTALGFVLMRGIQGMDWKSKQEFGTQSVHTALDLLGVKEYILRQGQAGQNPTFLKAAEQFSSGLYTRLHQLGNGNLPTILLPPQVLDRFVKMLFGGCLPVLLGLNNPSVPPETRAQTMASVNSTTSTILLTLAKLFQDASTSPNGPMAQAIRASGFQPSVPLLLSIFYSAISIHDSPSTANNLGILLSTIPSQPQPGQIPGTPAPSGQALALEFYRFGLSKDPNHPHLYTNYGSLLKDMGHIALAVEEYKKAVACQPNFAVALANLANAIKDMGRVQESIEYYRRAVEIEPNFPEAVCGLVNALGGVCDWNGRGSVGDDPVVTEDGKLLPVPVPDVNGKYPASGWMGRIVTLVDRQLEEGKKFGRGILKANNNLEYWMDFVAWIMTGERKSAALGRHEEIWKRSLQVFLNGGLHPYNEGGFLVRLVELGMRRTQHRWYRDSYGKALNAFPGMQLNNDTTAYQRPTLPSNLPGPAVPTVLPFHTFTYPLSARQVRLISHRNALKISYSTLMQPWMPRTVFPPPPPPTKLNIGYVSSDLNNHPLAHLMQSVFGFHDQSRFNVFCYATTPSDNSPYRIKIEREVPRFLDVSTWSTDQIVNRIAQDGIHILINLNGYTKGARNEVFAARPAPLQMEFMGFAGPLSGGWCDYVVADAIVCPPETAAAEEWRRRKDQGLPESPADLPGDIDPEEASDSWVYNEKFIYMPDSYFVCDHAQSSRDALSTLPPDQRWSVEEDLRWRKRRELFPGLRDDVVIFANFNQLYKIDPAIFQSWLKILRDVPNSILWLLRFPAAGEPHLLQTASLWAGLEVASRIRFTDVTSKDEHIARGRVVDLFLDTTECNAHTTACDILWSGTPMITYPRREWKMCSRVAASIVSATGYGSQMTVYSFEEYERRAVALASSLRYQYTSEIMDGLVVSHRRGQGELIELRKNLFLSRETSPLFDTRRWTRNLEKGYIAAWKRWVDGTEFEESPDWENETEIGRSGSIWIQNN